MHILALSWLSCSILIAVIFGVVIIGHGISETSYTKWERIFVFVVGINQIVISVSAIIFYLYR